MANFFGNVDLGGAARQFGLRLVADFVANNKGEFGGWGWLADKAANYFEKPDDSANAAVAKVGATAAMLVTPGELRAKTVEEGSRILRELPALDLTGKVHGILPAIKDLARYDAESWKKYCVMN